MPSTNYPGADRSQWKPQHGGIVMPGISKICLHTTETASWPGYPTFAPQMTVNVFTKQIRQHMALNVSASTLADPSSTAVRENRDSVLQIELIGYCDPARSNTSVYIYKWGDAEYLYLAEILAWFHTEWKVPLVSTVKWLRYPASYGNGSGQRLTGPQYDAYKGILGHQHASGNDHGDPGAINIVKLLDLAKALTLPPEPNPKPPVEVAPRPIPQPWRPGEVLPGAIITTPYGEKGDWQAGYHTGDDWNAGDGGEDYWFPVYAAKDGHVVYVGEGGWGPAYGRQVHIEYADGTRGMFAHLAKAEVPNPANVKAGQVVGRVGYSGNVRPVGPGGAHLHYEERVKPYGYGEDSRPPTYVVPPEPEVAPIRVATWNTRRSTYAADQGTARDWETRDSLARDFLLSVPGGVPEVLLTQETTAPQTRDIARFTGLTGVGNGYGGHPKDVAGDNCAVFFGDALERLQVVTVNTGNSSDPLARRFLNIVQVRHKETKAVYWFGSTHLNRANTGAEKERETRVLLDAAQDAGVDLKRLIVGLDANDAAQVDQPGVRRQAAKQGLSDIRNKLSDAQFRGDSWDTFTGWDADVEKTGRHIDIILVGSGIKVTEGEIVPVRNGASDHQMILCSLA
jgi:murein DD-endopeptidase MepM/ murein hydrolase activator NlpD